LKLQLTWLNAFWLMLPLLGWNLLLAPRLTDPRLTADSHSPAWLLIAENASRTLVFALPLFMPLSGKADWQSEIHRAGLILYVLGTVTYFATWLPLLFAPDSVWSNSAIGLLAPRLTPFLPFLGIALLGGSWPYGLISAVFIVLHSWHGIQNL
jgi:hypothetical protein